MNYLCMINVLEETLERYGADGLCNDEDCGCVIGELFPCGNPENAIECFFSKSCPEKAKEYNVDFWLEPIEFVRRSQ